jgi:hypothetical protein
LTSGYRAAGHILDQVATARPAGRQATVRTEA